MEAKPSDLQDTAGFAKLDVWKRACNVAVQLYSLLRECRDFGLRDQMQRAAVSIASNIAEGSERGTAAEFRQFLSYSKGSAAELRTQIHIACKVGILQERDGSLLITELAEISRIRRKNLERQIFAKIISVSTA